MKHTGYDKQERIYYTYLIDASELFLIAGNKKACAANVMDNNNHYDFTTYVIFFLYLCQFYQLGLTYQLCCYTKQYTCTHVLLILCRHIFILIYACSDYVLLIPHSWLDLIRQTRQGRHVIYCSYKASHRAHSLPFTSILGKIQLQLNRFLFSRYRNGILVTDSLALLASYRHASADTSLGLQ